MRLEHPDEAQGIRHSHAMNAPMCSPDQYSIPAVYMRGGTSRALVFHRHDLPLLSSPDEHKAWDSIFLDVMGSPDPEGRQLDGMGGGISSLSKIAVVGPSSHAGADVDFTFAQVSIKTANVSYRGNCGNISAAIGPFAVDHGLVTANGETALVRIHNTNTGKLIHARFPMAGNQAAVNGNGVIQGVAGTGALIELSFLRPDGAVTGKLFPTQRLRQTLPLSDHAPVEVSMLDAANPVVFLQASVIGMRGNESPETIAADSPRMHLLQEIRVAASLAMGVARSEEEARLRIPNLPLVAIVSPVEAERANLRVRMISAGQPHKAVPLTGAMCVSVAAAIGGTVVHDVVSTAEYGNTLISHPTGIMQVDSRLEDCGTATVVDHVKVYRTARRLMEGRVFVRA